MPLNRLVCALMLLVAFITGGLAFGQTKDGFIIGGWCGPPKASANDQTFAEIAAAGFNVVFPPCDGGRSYEENLKILRLSHENGLKALIIAGPKMATSPESPDFMKNIRSVVAGYAGKPGLYGYFLADEPSAEEFGRLGALTDALRKLDPAHSAYINLFPNYANARQMGLPRYRMYLQKYVELVHPNVISFDHYSQMKSLDPSQFIQNLSEVRAVSLSSNIPFIDTILVTAHGPYRSPTMGELAWQVYTSLAYGSRGIVYFTYWTPPPGGWNWQDAMIESNGTRTQHYHEVSNLNAQIGVLGKTLAKLRSTGVYFSKPTPWYGQALPSGWLVRQVRGKPVLIGEFQDDAGHTYLLFVNRDPLHGGECAVSLSDSVRSLTRINDSTEARTLTLVPGGRGNESQFYLEPGQGILFRVD